MVLDCVLRNKPLLLNNDSFIPYLVDALLLDPEHPRAEVPPEQKAWCQMTHTPPAWLNLQSSPKDVRP